MMAITGRLVGAAGPSALPVPAVGQIVENVTALRALVGSADLPAVTLRQFASVGPDLGGGVFVWDAAIATDDGVLRFNAGGLASVGAGWQRVGVDIPTAHMAGAVGDGTTDDTAALQRAIDAVDSAGGGDVLVPAGVYKLTSTLDLPSYVTLVGAGRDATVFAPTSTFSGLRGSDVPTFYAGVRELTVRYTNVGSGVVGGLDCENFSACRVSNVLVNMLGTSRGIGFALTEDSAGSSPYYNEFDGCDFAGGQTAASQGSVGFKFAHSSPASNFGANANKITGGHITNADYAVWLESGALNSILDLTTESIYIDHYRLDANALRNRIEVGYYEGVGGAYVLRLGGNSNRIVVRDTGGITVLDPAGTDGTNVAQITGATYGPNVPHEVDASVVRFSSSSTASFGGATSASLATANYNATLDDASGTLSVPRLRIGIAVFGTVTAGTGSPEGAVTGSVGDEYVRTDGGTGTTRYWKESGTATATGWRVASSPVGLLAPGSESYDTGRWHIQYQRLQLTGTQRLTLAGTARYILTDL